MSKVAEDAHAKWFAQHEIECARDLVVGAKVYRANYDRIEEGVVIRVSRCHISEFGNGSPEERDNGEHPYYVAEFPGGGWHSYEGQVYQWKFFTNLTDARKNLISQLRHRIEDHHRDVKKLEKLIASLESENG